VANQLNVAPQTVQDKYARQLGLTTAQFDRLLEPAKVDELKELLRRHFPEHATVVDGALNPKE
jgi:hypothetical protein